MKALTAAERLEIIEHTRRVAATMKTHRRGKYNFDGSGNSLPIESNFANFTGFVDGNPDGVNDDAFGQPERTEQAIFDIKRHIIREDIKSSTGDFVRRQNAVRTRNRQRVADARKAFDNR